MAENKKIIFILSFIFIVSVVVAANPYSFNLNDGGLFEPLEVKTGDSPLVIIDKVHEEMHEGEHYFVKTWLENTGGAGTSNYFAFTTPNTSTRIHAKTILFADADTIFNIYEDCIIEDGTHVLGINNDRDSSNTAELIPLAAPTIIDIGNLIFAGRNGGGRNPVGVALSGNYEIIAATNTSYCFEITKQTTANTIIDVDFFWYEDGGPPY